MPQQPLGKSAKIPLHGLCLWALNPRVPQFERSENCGAGAMCLRTLLRIRTTEYNFFSRKNYESVPRPKFSDEKILSRGRNSARLRIAGFLSHKE
jgi:hypothetical protein